MSDTTLMRRIEAGAERLRARGIEPTSVILTYDQLWQLTTEMRAAGLPIAEHPYYRFASAYRGLEIVRPDRDWPYPIEIAFGVRAPEGESVG
jgi:hypothetical protein